MENKMKFRKGQRAWSSKQGWGIVTCQTSGNHIGFIPYNRSSITIYEADGKWQSSDLYPTLFHKEQIFDYSEPEIPKGTLGYFWENNYSYRAVLGFYAGLSENGKHLCRGHLSFDNFCAYPQLPPHLEENP